MGFFIPRENLMKWTEPSNYQKDKSSLNSGLFLIGFSVIAIVVLLFTSLPQKKGLIGGALFLGFFTALFTAGDYFGDTGVGVKEDGISQNQGKYSRYSEYRDIESCIVTHKKFPSASFFHLEFTLKEQKTFTIRGPIGEVLLPNNVDLDFVLDLLLNKGIKIIENYDK